MDKKKVLFVATVVKTHINVFHLPYLQWFQAQGYETHVAAKNDFEKEECSIPYCDVHYDIPFERSPISGNNIKAYKQLKKIIDENQYEIIHCHTPVGAMLARLAAIEARKRGTKVIYTAHGFHFYKGASLINWLIYYPVEWMCSWFTDCLITINKEDYIFAKKYMKSNEIRYVPGVGVNIEQIINTYTDREIKRREIRIPKEAIMLLSIGELNRNKNHEIIIRALAELKNPEIYYVICGRGSLMKELKELAESLGIGEYVILLGFRQDIVELCKIADIFVFPSLREGLSMALMEAMASGLPCIVSKIRGNTDLIEHGKGGFCCDLDSVHMFRDAIKHVCESQDLMKEMSVYNLNAIKKFDINNVKREMIDIYKE